MVICLVIVVSKRQTYSLFLLWHRGFAEDAEQVEEEEEDDGTEMNAEDIEADLNKSGDASLLNVEAEKMALEDLSKFNTQHTYAFYNA